MSNRIPIFTQGLLSSNISKHDTTITLQTGNGDIFPVIPSGGYQMAMIYKVIDGFETAHEIVKVTARTNDVLTVVRQQNNTVARDFLTGDVVELMAKKADINTTDAGVQNIFKSFVFKRSSIALTVADTPEGGSYSSPNPTTPGWSDGIPDGAETIYVSTRIFTSDGLSPQDPVWSTPTKFAENGTDGQAYLVIIESSNGTEFRVGENSTSTLKALVFRNGTDVTDEFAPSQFRWRRVSINNNPPPNDDATWNALYETGYKQIIINVDDVNSKASFFCDILKP